LHYDAAVVGRTVQRFEMNGNEVVLGLLIERPGTSYDLQQRMKERFGSAQFGRGTASKAMKRLAENGLVEVAQNHRARTYVPTQAGIEHFRRWMRSSISTPPVREELHARIALCEPADLPAMVETVREAERDCMVKLQGLQWRMQDQQQGAATDTWEHRMGLMVRSGDVAWWGGRIKWLQSVRMSLERERQRYAAQRPSIR
jgi:DNA-binding PadR family transcriptional regulator